MTRTTLTNEQKADAIEDIALSRGDDFREDYSGRGMYGRECVGIVTESPDSVVEDAVEAGVRGAVMDSMGRSTIVYWPNVSRNA